ncbi:MAG: helix-turn-helix transcriptional regulator [Ktedonobacteraceae bacterium]|nr:helix-turn-helix transcriptional regulator [Ktedonobacteraceae bacterium]
MEAHEKKPNSRLRRERDLKGWSQATLAEKVGTSEQGVNRWENGHHRPNRYFQTELCRVFGKDAQELGFMDDPQTAEQAAQTDAREEKRAEQALALSPAPLPEPGEEVHEPDERHEQGVRDQHTVLVLPSSVVQLGALEGSVIPDGATAFGITFARIVTLVQQWYGIARFCSDLQARLDQEIQGLDMLNLHSPFEESTLSRHDFLVLLATLPPALLAETKQAHKVIVRVEEFLPQCAASITACWHLSAGSQLETIPPILDAYLPTLLSITTYMPTYREVAADLVAQCYLLKTILAWHLEGLSQAEAYCLQALNYSVMANNPNLQMITLNRHTDIAYYDSNFSLALTKSEAALALLQKTDQGRVFPFMAGEVYMSLATFQAYHRLKREAEQSLEEAQKAFTAQSCHVSIPIYADCGELLISFRGGLTHYYLGQEDRQHAEQAWTVLKQFGQLQPSTTISERLRLECLNSRALAAIQLNEMEEAIACFEAAKQGARDLGSKQRSTEVGHVYSQMLKQWPNERRIVTLAPSSQQ